MAPSSDGATPIDAYLSTLRTDALVDLVLELAEASPEASRVLALNAAAATGNHDAVATELLAAVRSVTSSRGFIDYRRSFAVASDVQSVLDDLAQLLDRGGATAAQPALLRALTATRRITLKADDSGGAIGDACQRAADLYARSCREGTIDGVKLAKWLLKFREDSPGWPETPLQDFAPALGDRGLAVYRKRVAELDAEAAGRDRFDRFRVDQMLLELADHDGDVDAAVALLVRDDGKQAFGGAIDRLVAAGREDEALALTQQAVEAGRVGRLGQHNEYWLDPVHIAMRYRHHGREREALEVMRRAFSREPSWTAFQAVAAFADAMDLGEVERSWARDEARRIAGQPHQNGRALVEIALAEGDLDAAWSAADEFGAGDAWSRLADASKEAYPRRAIALHLAAMQPHLEHADRRTYVGIAKQLKVMREFYLLAEALDEFELLVRGLRETYRRRPGFIAELDKARLPH